MRRNNQSAIQIGLLEPSQREACCGPPIPVLARLVGHLDPCKTGPFKVPLSSPPTIIGRHSRSTEPKDTCWKSSSTRPRGGPLHLLLCKSCSIALAPVAAYDKTTCTVVRFGERLRGVRKQSRTTLGTLPTLEWSGESGSGGPISFAILAILKVGTDKTRQTRQ